MSINEYGDEWHKDKLRRKDDADYLSTYLIAKHEQANNSLNNGSFVLNINAEWGFGKTYFLKNWADDLSQKNHPVVYFDAWKNDFSKEPLLALVSEINEQLSPYFDKKIGESRATKVKHFLNTWYESGKKLVSPTSPIILGAIAKKLSGLSFDELSELMEEDEISVSEETPTDSKDEVKNTVSSVVSKTATRMMASHNSTKKTINNFKLNLGKLTNHISSLKTINLPMFIFIDELDRCRPNYAIEVLENTKHLFGVPGVFFVVATASEQLGHSIKAIYGQDFDSPSYLKRFFDQTYTLQDPDRYSFSSYLFDKYELIGRDNMFSPIEQQYCSTDHPVVEAFAVVTSAFNCGLRDMEQYCIIIDSISLTFNKERIHIIYLLFLIVLKENNKVAYKAFINGVLPKFAELELNHSEYDKGIETFDNHQGVMKISLGTVISSYFGFSNKSISNIYYKTPESEKRIIQNIKNELLVSLNNNTPETAKHYLKAYPSLIEQAGKMT